MKRERAKVSERFLGTVAAIARSYLPCGGKLHPGADDIDVAAKVMELVNLMPRRPRMTLNLALLVLEYAPYLSLHIRPLSRIADRDCEAFVAQCSQLPGLKHALLAVAAFAEIAYFSDPRIGRLIGYNGQPLKAVENPAQPAELSCEQYPGITGRRELKVDACVIGSGAGGATVARYLAEAGFSVAILEEGGLFTSASFRSQPPAERLVRMYRDAGLTATIGRPPVILPMGCAVGGTTVVNSGSCFRAPDEVLRSWQAAGASASDPGQLAPYFEIVETNLNVTSVTDDILGPNGEVMRRGAELLGLCHGPIPRAQRGCHGTGQCAFGCPLDAKQAMHVSYLPAAVSAGATIFAHCPVTRIITRDGEAQGVEAEIKDPRSGEKRGELRVWARAVVVAAGATFSPALLRRSRISDPGHHLGKHLRIHPGLAVTGIFAHELRAWRGVMQSYHVSERLGDGILLEATYPPPGIGWGANNFPYVGRRHKEILAAGTRTASIGVMVSDRGEGRVRCLPGLGPILHYNLDHSDNRRLVEGVLIAVKILFAAGAKRVLPGLPDLPELSSAEEASRLLSGEVRHLSRLKLSAFHPLGSCRMADNSSQGVVDSSCQVHGVRNLYVADASILPGSTVVNPQITIMAFATRTAQKLADVLG